MLTSDQFGAPCKSVAPLWFAQYLLGGPGTTCARIDLMPNSSNMFAGRLHMVLMIMAYTDRLVANFPLLHVACSQRCKGWRVFVRIREFPK